MLTMARKGIPVLALVFVYLYNTFLIAVEQKRRN